MRNDVEEIDADEHEETLERVGAIDVATASGKVCVRVPGRQRRITKVWDVSSTTNAIMGLADELAEMGIERVVVESTSDYWRPFFYLLEARGLVVWLVNARDVKQVPGRPKTDKLDAVWLAKLNERGMLRTLLRPAERDPRAPGLHPASRRTHRGTFPAQAAHREAARGQPDKALYRRDRPLGQVGTTDARGADRRGA
jgi:transposase